MENAIRYRAKASEYSLPSLPSGTRLLTLPSGTRLPTEGCQLGNWSSSRRIAGASAGGLRSDERSKNSDCVGLGLAFICTSLSCSQRRRTGSFSKASQQQSFHRNSRLRHRVLSVGFSTYSTKKSRSTARKKPHGTGRRLTARRPLPRPPDGPDERLLPRPADLSAEP